MTYVTPLNLPPSDPFNIQGVKHFIFNETGNIMMATTEVSSDTIQPSVRNVFAEVSVFFAAMTKAISQTVNPYGTPDKTGKLPYYSLYNYDALESVIDGSGYFVHVNEEDISYSTQTWGADFSKELLEAVLGLASGSGALVFASAMIASMGQEGLNIKAQTSSRTSQVANIVFVCEYLLGMPLVSALVVTADATLVSDTVNAGPCFKEQDHTTILTAHKDTYMFVTPSFIREYADDLNSGMNDPAYLNLIMDLESLVERTPRIDGVWQVPATGAPVVVEAPGPLTPGDNYAMYGQFLGQQTGTASVALTPSNPTLTVNISQWDDEGIKFSVGNTGTSGVAGETITITLDTGRVLAVGPFNIGGKPGLNTNSETRTTDGDKPADTFSVISTLDTALDTSVTR